MLKTESNHFRKLCYKVNSGNLAHELSPKLITLYVSVYKLSEYRSQDTYLLSKSRLNENVV